EGGEAVADLVEAGEVVGCEGFALDDGEVDFGLVEPGGALGQVDQVRVRPGAGDPGERGGAAVGGAVVGDPEHPAGAGVRLGGHDLLDQPGERGDPGGGLAPAGDLPAADVPGGQVGQGAAALVVVLDAHRAGLAGRQGGVAAAAGLDGGLLIGADDVVVAARRRAVPGPGVRVERPGGLYRELRVADRDPGPVLPGLERVTGEPAADGGRRGGDLAAGGQFAGQVRAAPPRQRHA